MNIATLHFAVLGAYAQFPEYSVFSIGEAPEDRYETFVAAAQAPSASHMEFSLNAQTRHLKATKAAPTHSMPWSQAGGVIAAPFGNSTDRNATDVLTKGKTFAWGLRDPYAADNTTVFEAEKHRLHVIGLSVNEQINTFSQVQSAPKFCAIGPLTGRHRTRIC
ncbi:hypothetical protein CERZMDRAFT_100819 [Cercospora zeae-maydis SCOH1-5]|uniref:Uncharacterized protein n=1 Tax=Cercospora zeae-maydis SCOH1-5 TaxID=717836 RepID=A0A6A6F778_9PEZI|nr:hypothetical protein CERZMDRAFT_100819 [Cercospora zeae-maydis SCOH1-5]